MKDSFKTIRRAANSHSLAFSGTLSNGYSFKIGALSPEVKVFHQQGTYTEEEVKLLCSKAQMKYAFASVSEQPYSVDEFDKQFDYWFNQNKKK